ncbi:MAG: hypothetical protein WCZ48_08190, partial [Bacillota bacterium]
SWRGPVPGYGRCPRPECLRSRYSQRSPKDRGSPNPLSLGGRKTRKPPFARPNVGLGERGMIHLRTSCGRAAEVAIERLSKP